VLLQSELQWILHLPPEARKSSGLKLRLHVLAFIHFLLCRELFPDGARKPRASPPTVIITPGTLPTLQQAMVMRRDDLRKSIADAAEKQLLNQLSNEFGRSYSRLTKAQIVDVLKRLLDPELSVPAATSSSSSQSTSTPSLPSTSSPKVDTIMGLFLHTKVAHFGRFFEQMDFKNVSTERGEGFNHFVKWVLKRFSSKNLCTPQPLREVLVRWSVSIPLFETLYTQVSTLQRIAREFKQHSFEELEVDMTTYAADLQIFLPHLVEQGYREVRLANCRQ